MTAPQTSPDAVLFLSAALQASGLPPELEGTSGASPLERLAGRLQQEGFVRLRVILLSDTQGPSFRHRLARGLLDRIGQRTATAGIALGLETAASLEDWLAAQPEETDWIVQRPTAAELTPMPRDLGAAVENPWLERMRRNAGLGTMAGGDLAPAGRRALA